MPATLQLAQTLIRRPSVTPADGGCQDLIADALKPFGFEAEFINSGLVRNIWLRRGSASPLFVFAGHTDVVPTGSEQNWRYPPFEGKVVDGTLHGRGAADMKGSLAAMVTACQNFCQTHPDHQGSIALLITSDEEGPAIDGTVRVVETLSARGEVIDWCLVGEPTSSEQLGDTIKNGRRGSLGGILTVRGIQGHVAYPHLADNPLHRLAGIINQLVGHRWDEGNEFFPATTFQVSNITGGTGASNVIPGEAQARFNLRHCPDTSAQSIRETIDSICAAHAKRFSIDWDPLGLPYQTLPGELVDATRNAIAEIVGIQSDLSTAGGTSDGRFIAPTGAQVIELGPINRTIHQVDEAVSIEDLEHLSQIYQRILEHLLS